MGREHIDDLTALRDVLVEDRRGMVKACLADPHGIGQMAGDFMGLQQMIDAVERAIAHEHSLDPAGRKGPAGFSMPPLPPRSGPPGH